MSIDDLGRQLVKEGRDRRDKVRKRQERYERRAALAQIALPIGAKIIEEGLIQKSQDFFNSEQVLNLTREFNKATTKGSMFINNEQQIQSAAGGNAEAWFEDQNFEAAKTQLMDTLTEEQIGGPQQLNMREIDIRARAIARDMAVNQAKEHREGLAVALNLGTKEEFDSELARKLKPTTPTTIVGAVGRWASTKLGGQSTAERQADAINDFKRGYQFTSTQQMDAAVKEFQTTNNWRSAFIKAANTAEGSEGQGYWADKIKEFRGMKPYERALETNLNVVTRPDGTKVLEGWTQRRNVDGSIIPDSITPIDQKIVGIDPEAARLYDMNFKEALKRMFDPLKASEKYLTQEGVDAYEAVLNSKTDADNNIYSRWDFNGAEEHQVLFQTFRDFISDPANEKYIIPQYTQAQILKQRELLASEWFGDILAEVDATKAREIRSTFNEEFEGYQKYYSEESRGRESTPPTLSPEFVTAYGDGDETLARQKLREAVIAWNTREWVEDEIFNGTDEEINSAIGINSSEETNEDEDTGENQTSVIPENRRSSLEDLVVQPWEVQVANAELDWPDEYKKLQEMLARAGDISNRRERQSQELRIQNKIDNFVSDREAEIARLSRVDINQRGRRIVGPSAEDLEQIAKLEEEIAQFIAMQDSSGSTILSAGGDD